MSKLCPSAQPGMDRAMVLGVVQHDGPSPVVQYLNERLPATPEVLALSAPLKPTEVFRLAATCAEHKCPHFDGADCQLATRVVKMLPAAVDSLPPCAIRKECRWHAQEGEAACKRCPEVTTVSYDLSQHARDVSGLPVVEESIG
ncbi:hypothetical protein C5688_08560 [Methylocystis sp. MitZ-2018]|nr:hypothetical protein C5688_08560 [Methylocystis sp. MitZ-2018]